MSKAGATVLRHKFIVTLFLVLCGIAFVGIPAQARFLQTDPIGYKADLNWYAYVQNDPTNKTDPSGEEPPGIWEELHNEGKVPEQIYQAHEKGEGIANTIILTVGSMLVPGAGAPALSKSEQILENAAQGARGEAATEATLGESVASKQVTFKTSDGTRTRTDFVTKGKDVVETKTGNAKLSPGQQKLQNDINAGREVTPVGKNAENAGLQPGQPTKMNSCRVDRPC